MRHLNKNSWTKLGNRAFSAYISSPKERQAFGEELWWCNRYLCVTFMCVECAVCVVSVVLVIQSILTISYGHWCYIGRARSLWDFAGLHYTACSSLQASACLNAMDICVCIYIYVCVHVQVYTFVYVCECAHVPACMCAWWVSTCAYWSQ